MAVNYSRGTALKRAGVVPISLNRSAFLVSSGTLHPPKTEVPQNFGTLRR